MKSAGMKMDGEGERAKEEDEVKARTMEDGEKARTRGVEERAKMTADLEEGVGIVTLPEVRVKMPHS